MKEGNRQKRGWGSKQSPVEKGEKTGQGKKREEDEKKRMWMMEPERRKQTHSLGGKNRQRSKDWKGGKNLPSKFLLKH